MKMMKLALLGTAALAAVSVSARADDLSDLKAQIEALQADVAALQATPSVPAGYQLMTVGEAARILPPGMEFDPLTMSKTVTTIGILPTADMPASTNIQWSGYVRAALTYRNTDGTDIDATATKYSITSASGGVTTTYSYAYADGSDLHIKARGLLAVTGTTDTAVGEVGASVNFFGDFDGSGAATVKMDTAWGWWKMTPELTFGGGYNGSLATIGHGIEIINDDYVSRGGTNSGGGDFTQFRLSYASGPLSLAMAVEHTDEGDNVVLPGWLSSSGSPLGFAAEAKFVGDMFSAEVAGFIRDDASDGETTSQIGIGLSANLSDMFKVSAAASYGSDLDFTDADGTKEEDGDVTKVSVAVEANLSDSIMAEVGAGWADYNASGTANDTEVTAVMGGIYYTPVSQLTMGAQASLVNREDDWDDVDIMQAAFVTYFRF
jgi:hypothetical protein